MFHISNIQDGAIFTGHSASDSPIRNYKTFYLLKNDVSNSEKRSHVRNFLQSIMLITTWHLYFDSYFNSLIMRYGAVYFSVKRHELNNSVLPTIFERHAKKHPSKVCFYFENQVWTFKQVE